MAWNGSGTYSPPGASFPEVNGTVIDAARFNATITDVATGITAALAKNGENSATANLPMGGFVHTGLGQANATGQTLAWGKNISVVDITSSGNTILGDAVGDTLNVAGGILQVDGSGNFLMARSAPAASIISSIANTGNAGRQIWDIKAKTGAAGDVTLRLGAEGDGPDVFIGAPTAHDFLLFAGGAERVRVANTGQILIGTTTLGIGASGLTALSIQNSSATIYQSIKASGGQELLLGAYASGGILGTFSNHPLAIRTNNTDRLTIDAAGAGTYSGTLTATAFSGPLTGNVTGNVTGSSGSATGNAATATALQTARTIGGTSFNGTANIAIALAATATALATARTIGGTSFDGTANIAVGLAATATALATPRTIGGTSFDGTANIAVALAATATALATARAINGVNFDGTAAITVTAAAGTLTGATLAAGVTASSLTSAGATFNLVGGAASALKIGGNITQFESAEQACPSTTFQDLNVAHGGPRVPDLFSCVLRCKTTELGFAVGDEVDMFSQIDVGANVVSSQGYANATVVGLLFTRTGSNPPNLRHKTTGTLTTVTAANWKVVFRAHWL